jgi:transposase
MTTAAGGLLGVQEFPAAPAGYTRLMDWLGGFGTVCLARIEGTGSYGAGQARHVTAAGIRVVEVDRSDRQDRRHQGIRSLDAVSSARGASLASVRRAQGPRWRRRAIRALIVAKRSAAGERNRTINQAGALVLTEPDDVRAQFARTPPLRRSPASVAATRPLSGLLAIPKLRIS